MKIAVIEHPRIISKKHFNDIANTPLWSCLIGGYSAASMQEGGFNIDYIDTTITGWNFEQTIDALGTSSFDLICVNLVYIWEHTAAVFAFCKQLKEINPECHLNLFGFFPTLAWQAILNGHPYIDSIAVGECETTHQLLATTLAHNTPWQNTPGIASTGNPFTPRAAAKNPDIFPFPLRTGNHSTLSILASRGCYNHCSFCPVPSFYNQGPLWHGRSVDNIILEIKTLVEQGHRKFYFVDPNFIGPGKKGRQRTLQLMDRLRPLNISFGMETRPNDLDSEILESLTAAGFNSLLLGVESGSPKVLDKLNKGASLNVSERAINLCRTYGVEPEIGFLMFVPDSTLEDIRHNYLFLKKNMLLDRLDRTANLLSHYQIVLQGTSGYNQFKKENRMQASGYLDFEGEINYRDPRVKWLAEHVIFAAHLILQEMSKSNSPIYWKNDQKSGHSSLVNKELLTIFTKLLAQADQDSPLPNPNTVQEKIARKLQDCIRGETTVFAKNMIDVL